MTSNICLVIHRTVWWTCKEGGRDHYGFLLEFYVPGEQGCCAIDSMVKCIDVHLHESFPQPVRTLFAPFVLQDKAWGSSSVTLYINYMDAFSIPTEIHYNLDLDVGTHVKRNSLVFRKLSIEVQLKYLSFTRPYKRQRETAEIVANKLKSLPTHLIVSFAELLLKHKVVYCFDNGALVFDVGSFPAEMLREVSELE